MPLTASTCRMPVCANVSESSGSSRSVAPYSRACASARDVPSANCAQRRATSARRSPTQLVPRSHAGASARRSTSSGRALHMRCSRASNGAWGGSTGPRASRRGRSLGRTRSHSPRVALPASSSSQSGASPGACSLPSSPRRVRRNGSQRPSSVASGPAREALSWGSLRAAARPRQPRATGASASEPSSTSRAPARRPAVASAPSRAPAAAASSTASQPHAAPATSAARASGVGCRAAPSHAPASTASAAATMGRLARRGAPSPSSGGRSGSLVGFNALPSLEHSASRAPVREKHRRGLPSPPASGRERTAPGC